MIAAQSKNNIQQNDAEMIGSEKPENGRKKVTKMIGTEMIG